VFEKSWLESRSAAHNKAIREKLSCQRRSVVATIMSTHTTTLGCCPRCGTAIPQIALLIEYERGDGLAAYAECPTCRGVVQPE
jgi:hypothetical protein